MAGSPRFAAPKLRARQPLTPMALHRVGGPGLYSLEKGLGDVEGVDLVRLVHHGRLVRAVGHGGARAVRVCARWASRDGGRGTGDGEPGRRRERGARSRAGERVRFKVVNCPGKGLGSRGLPVLHWRAGWCRERRAL